MRFWILLGLIAYVVGSSFSQTPASPYISLPYKSNNQAVIGTWLNAWVNRSHYYVAKNGNDSWSGTLPAPNNGHTDGPFLTLGKAQSVMQGGSTKETVVRAGTYSIASTWSFSFSDANEVWLAYPGEVATIDGATTGYVNVAGVSPITFEGLTFSNMAALGMYLNSGTGNATIRWNTFYNCTAQCISGGGASNNLIDSNVFSGQTVGDPSAEGSAVQLWFGASSNTISHNLFQNLDGGGVNFSASQTDPPCNSNIVDRNLFWNVDANATDLGAIYMADRSHSATGNQITNNVIDGNGGTSYLTDQTKAIYLDDLMSNVTVTGNICRACGTFAWQIHAGDHNTISNNIFDLSSVGTLLGLYQNNVSFPDHGMGSNVVSHNLVYFSSTVPASLYQVNIGVSDSLPTSTTNLYYSVLGSMIPNGATIIDVNPIYANPQFFSSITSLYLMPGTSPAYSSAGFTLLGGGQGPLPYNP